jgi:hypothetical protein
MPSAEPLPPALPPSREATPPASPPWQPPPWAFPQSPPYRPAPPGWTAPKAPTRPPPAPFRVRELLATLAVVALLDAVLWGAGTLRSGGFGMALLFTTVPVVLVLSARGYRRSIRLAVVTALLGAVAARSAFDPTPGTVFFGLSLLGVFAVTLRSRRVFVPDALASALAGVGALPSRLAALAAGLRRIQGRSSLGRVAVQPILVPTLLCVLFAGIFALANPVVSHGLSSAVDALSRVVGIPSLLRVLLWALAIVAAASLVRPARHLFLAAEAAPTETAATDGARLLARNALAALNAVFLAYNALDAAYLWAGAPPPGQRTQEYAHQGAFWLTVALILLTAIVGVLFRGSLAHDTRARLTRGLAYAWMAQGLVLAVGTYRRIAIHVENSGLSDLRIVGILGTTLAVVGVVLVAVKLKRQRTFAWLVRRQLDAFALTLVLYAVFPTHLVSAHVNVARIQRGEYRPLLHMFRQSTMPESVPVLVTLLDHPDLRVRQGIAALLEDQRARLIETTVEARTWRERDVATGRALSALDRAAPRAQRELGDADGAVAKTVLLDLSRAANEDRSLEELFAIPSAEGYDVRRRSRSRGDL